LLLANKKIQGITFWTPHACTCFPFLETNHLLCGSGEHMGQYIGTYAAIEEYMTDEWLIQWSANPLPSQFLFTSPAVSNNCVHAAFDEFLDILVLSVVTLFHYGSKENKDVKVCACMHAWPNKCHWKASNRD